ncbi:MAG: hypothetical protein HUU38_29705 [Anaerolineales bacterium]|jgi:hypothetical protein|nr:hypothetical protein [Anaerolineales bacterium]
MSFLDIETRAGRPLRVGETRLVPFAQTARVTFPGSGGVVWSRPTAILAQTADGQETVLPVRDVTREAQLTLMGLGVLGALLIWIFYRK